MNESYSFGLLVMCHLKLSHEGKLMDKKSDIE